MLSLEQRIKTGKGVYITASQLENYFDKKHIVETFKLLSRDTAFRVDTYSWEIRNKIHELGESFGIHNTS